MEKNTTSQVHPNTVSSATVATARAYPVPPRQRPYELALDLAFDVLSSRRFPNATLSALGGEWKSGIIRLPVLSQYLQIDLAQQEVIVEPAGHAKHSWALLVLHYLSAEDASLDLREVSLHHFDDCRGYLAAFERRIIGRFLATVGRTCEHFIEASEALGGTRQPGVGVSYRFVVLPRVPITITRYDEDEEFGPGANLLYRADIEVLLPPEDRVVIAEALLDALSGKSLVDDTAPR
ncbi:MAG: DUF3786 domain-containing protein [Armatimonadota bacterium]